MTLESFASHAAWHLGRMLALVALALGVRVRVGLAWLLIAVGAVFAAGGQREEPSNTSPAKNIELGRGVELVAAGTYSKIR